MLNALDVRCNHCGVTNRLTRPQPGDHWQTGSWLVVGVLLDDRGPMHFCGYTCLAQHASRVVRGLSEESAGRRR